MRKYAKTLGGGAGGALGPVVAAAVAAQWPAITSEMALLIGILSSAVFGAFGAYLPANKP